ncbi:hypothetical protein K470DRAFT_273378 [Piedraia hortae CBS 480.64]|uniref:NHL repeat-containing protein n=1 Tax=Piedraia hortae CBS 480.64 TaxID=1314780 RepID=A0A6A7BPY1_9PEZI|nr:hypothetical protein K470DRAFT_273378 [Piedraia hortae CBS 480.64]
MRLSALLFAGLALATPVVHRAAADCQPTIRTLFRADNLLVENLAQTSKGDLILNPLTSQGRIYSVSPYASQPRPEVIAILPNYPAADGLTGISEVWPGIFAVGGQKLVGYAASPNTSGIYLLDVRSGVTHAKINKVASIPAIGIINGIVAIPNTGLVLVADSVYGRVYRVNTVTGKVDLVMEGDLFKPLDQSVNRISLGINGVKIRNGWLYFTSSARGLFGRVKISPRGDRQGKIQVIATLDIAHTAAAYDDFTLDRNLNAYIGLQNNAIVKITPQGNQTVLATGVPTVNGTYTVDGPSSVVIDRWNPKKLYVSENGGANGGKNGGLLEMTLC